MAGFLVILAFVGLFALGFPVVLAIGIPCLIYLAANGLPIDLLAQRTLYAMDSFPLVAVPVFLFVGSLMNSAGISKYIYKFADTLVSRLPGGLAQVNIFGSLVFAGMSGSALADIGGIGRIEIDAMKEKGYNRAFAAAVTSSSAIVGPIFPPSIPLIIYGTVTGVSVLQLLLGGILPGLLCVAGLMLMTAWLARKRNYPRADRWPTIREILRDFWPALPAILAPVLLIVGMLAGFFTPTEIASVTVVYTIAISALFYRELTWHGLYSAALETIRSSAAILLIVAVAALFGWILSVERVPQILAGWMLSISSDPLVLLLLVNILLLIVGMFLDSTTAILVIAPIIAKPLMLAGVDPVHLGMVVVFNLMVGLLTPPMGLALYLVADIAQVRMRDVLREMMPFYIPLGLTLLVITYVPWITTFIPRLAFGN
ncbi:TRAP transporter large permease [Rhabdaerophilum sp. SD176]|uniref:TRAP transporter large permease n=1 Tax=Rhabdaerophilum sp. SD176 TaxID=2983548 RepID=UPI0024DF9643|nr:TRAP transporter large permease [Rhabdaerophilum sp. SD176]